MRTIATQCSAIVAILLVAQAIVAQNQLRGIATMGSGDFASIEQKAEAGDTKAYYKWQD